MPVQCLHVIHQSFSLGKVHLLGQGEYSNLLRVVGYSVQDDSNTGHKIIFMAPL